ncbi:MAG: molybdopterin synthase catalytic subunit [Oleiphilaceae bacterium]|jgi:molybdopterin synthase catalytic subunit
MPAHIGSIRIQEADFSIDEEYKRLRIAHPAKNGAICTFSGLVREFGDREGVTDMFLEHYPGMTEQSLQLIINQAAERWKLNEITVVHRVGLLCLSDQIVFVGVSSAHRADAFAACEFIMDYLKTDAPFWKKECHEKGSHWVEAKESDQKRTKKWS